MTPDGGASRRTLLRGAGVAALAGLSSAAVSGCGGPNKSGHVKVTRLAPDVKARNVAILGAALELERRTVAAYIAGIPLLPHPEAKAAEQLLNEELQHTGELIALLTGIGAKAQPRAASYAIGHPRTAPEVIALLHSLEALQIATYLRAIPQLAPAPLRAATATVLASDAQHIALLRTLQGVTPVPSPFVTGAE